MGAVHLRAADEFEADEGTSWECRQCQHRDRDDARCCRGCGAALMPSTCAACAERLPAEARYCPSCGVAVPSTAGEVMPAYLRGEDPAPASTSLTPTDTDTDDGSPPELALLRQLWADRRRRRRRRRIIGAVAVAAVVMVAGIALTWRRADAPQSAASATPVPSPSLPQAAPPPAAPPPASEPVAEAPPQTPVTEGAASAPAREAVAPPEPRSGEAERAGVVAGARRVTSETSPSTEPRASPERSRRPRSTASVPPPAAAPSASPEASAAQGTRPGDEAPSGDGGAAIDWLFRESSPSRP